MPGSRPDSTEMDAGVLSMELERNYSYTSSSSTSIKEKTVVRETVKDVSTEEEGWDKSKGAPNMEQIALKALHVDDDPTLNPWTFRVFFIGEFVFFVRVFVMRNKS